MRHYFSLKNESRSALFDGGKRQDFGFFELATCSYAANDRFHANVMGFQSREVDNCSHRNPGSAHY